MAIALIAMLAIKATSGARRAFSLVRDHPWQFAAGAALALAWWQWTGKQSAIQSLQTARSSLTAERAARKADQAQWQRQVAGAKAATAAAERKSKEIATDAQASHQALLADNAGLRDYIAGHRLWSVRPSAAATAGAAGDRGAGVLADRPTGSFVATAEADLVACDADYAYAAGAHQFVLEMIESGLAK